MKKVLLIALTAFFAVSCSSDSTSSSTNDPNAGYPMKAVIDSETFDAMQPEAGGNQSDANSGTYGANYHVLEGLQIKAANKMADAKIPVTGNKFYIRLVIPKNNISTGVHNFTTTLQPDDYYADLNIVTTLGDSGEDEATISGTINVTSYDVTSRRIKGSFVFTTSNGVTTAETHDLSGSFNYILAQ